LSTDPSLANITYTAATVEKGEGEDSGDDDGYGQGGFVNRTAQSNVSHSSNRELLKVS
jgi:hypothetical protein